jgi:hypothetical protein
MAQWWALEQQAYQRHTRAKDDIRVENIVVGLERKEIKLEILTLKPWGGRSRGFFPQGRGLSPQELTLHIECL